MVEASDIRQHMPVVGSDGKRVGRVDAVDGDRIKITRKESPDGKHHYIPLSSVARVDAEVHLATAAAAALLAAGVADADGAGDGHGPLPPIKNRAVEDPRPRGNYYLPWILIALAVIAALLLIRGCMHREAGPVVAAPAPSAATTAPLPVEAVKLPDGQSVNLEPQTLNYELQRYLASDEATPKTFQFDKLNFDTASAAIRPEDQPNVDALAQILSAYPKAKVQIVGYTDARGTAPANDTLGQQRADAVVAALAAKGIDQRRIEAKSGGASNPTDTNATPQGQAENRRTELVVTAK